MIINIKGEDVELKYSFRSLMLYENIQNKSFTPESTTDVLVYMFCVIHGSKKNLDFTFDEFLDLVDENPNIIVEFSQWLTNAINVNNTLSAEEEQTEDQKKTKKK